MCFDTLNNYGKEPEQEANAIKLFKLMLGKYNIWETQEAFYAYLEKSSKVPTPADIIKNIEEARQRAIYTPRNEEEKLIKELGLANQRRRIPHEPEERIALLRNYENKNGNVDWVNIRDYYKKHGVKA